MSWAMGLFVVGLIFVAFVAGLLWHAQSKHTVLKYRDVNACKPGAFKVGGFHDLH